MSVAIRIKKLRDSAIVPQYQTAGAAAMDLHACIDEPLTLQPMERAAIPLGFAMELPDGYEAQIRARSGLSLKQGLGMVNGVGTIDSDYRGEVMALAINWGTEPVVVEPGMRVAQMVIARYERADWQESTNLDDTIRGAGGFGSTGA